MTVVKIIAIFLPVMIIICWAVYVYAAERLSGSKKKPSAPEYKFAAFEACKHTWKDFPWYLEAHMYPHTCDVIITKPYVCIHCKERRNEILQKNHREFESTEEVFEYVLAFKEEYQDKLQPRAVVEEQIRDMQLVDREALKIAEQIGIIDCDRTSFCESTEQNRP